MKYRRLEGKLANPYLKKAKPFLDNGNGHAFLLRYSKDGEDRREKLVAEYAWALPNEKALQWLVRLSPIVEIGAGSGYWARLICNRGGRVVAYDNKPPPDCQTNFKGKIPWFPVKQGDEKAAKNHPTHTLFLCWPPYDNPMAQLAVFHFEKAGGRKLVYIGERRGGCTAGEGFFKRLDRNWRETGSEVIPQWGAIHDSMTIYTR